MTFWDFANNHPITTCVLAFFGMCTVIRTAAIIGACVSAFLERKDRE